MFLGLEKPDGGKVRRIWTVEIHHNVKVQFDVLDAVYDEPGPRLLNVQCPFNIGHY